MRTIRPAGGSSSESSRPTRSRMSRSSGGTLPVRNCTTARRRRGCRMSSSGSSRSCDRGPRTASQSTNGQLGAQSNGHAGTNGCTAGNGHAGANGHAGTNGQGASYHGHRAHGNPPRTPVVASAATARDKGGVVRYLSPRLGRDRLGDQGRSARPAPAQEPGPLPQERALPGDRARADERPGDRSVQDQLHDAARSRSTTTPGS